MLLAETGQGLWLGSWTATAILRLLVAAGLGSIVGLEREQHGRSAGLRTHLLVSLGAAMAMVVSLHFGQVYRHEAGAIQVDPARVAYGVMAGIGFLGAGAIIHYGAGVRGLTTAASLWCAAAIGLGAGFGMFLISLVATGVVLFALAVLDFVDRLIPTKITRKITICGPDCSDGAIQRYRELLTGGGAKVVNIDYTRDFENNRAVITYRVSGRGRHVESAAGALRKGAPEVTQISVE